PVAPPGTSLTTTLDGDTVKGSNVFQDIALAHREIYALYEIAQVMGSSLNLADTMTLIASKLSSLVPFSCCALFLRADSAGTLRCRFAVGVEADVVQHLAMREGQGLSGWVARSRRPLLNASPRAELDAGGRSNAHTVLMSALVFPLVFNDHFI